MSQLLREDPVEVKLAAMRVTQKIGDFYIGVMPAKDLVKICDFDIRRINNEDGLGDYMGIQREIDPKRIKEIVKYIGTVDATFPTAVIIAVDQRCAEISPIDAAQSNRLVQMTLKNVRPNDENGDDEDESTQETVILFRQIARVLDGQHRVKALMDAKPETFDMNVAIFVGSDIAVQAGIFSTVNLAQTKVNRSLVYDLFSYNESRSPEKMCHEMAVVLDRESGSPFKDKIKRLGVASDGKFSETLSQATFVRGILPYLSDDPITDRDLGKRGRPFPPAADTRKRKLIFRDFLVRKRDDELTVLIWDYFSCVQEKWPTAWDFSGTGKILNKTTGFDALIKFLRAAYLELVVPGGVVTRAQFKAVFDKITLTDGDFTKEKYIPGSSGTGALYRDLLSQSGIAKP